MTAQDFNDPSFKENREDDEWLPAKGTFIEVNTRNKNIRLRGDITEKVVREEYDQIQAAGMKRMLYNRDHPISITIGIGDAESSAWNEVCESIRKEGNLNDDKKPWPLDFKHDKIDICQNSIMQGPYKVNDVEVIGSRMKIEFRHREYGIIDLNSCEDILKLREVCRFEEYEGVDPLKGKMQ